MDSPIKFPTHLKTNAEKVMYFMEHYSLGDLFVIQAINAYAPVVLENEKTLLKDEHSIVHMPTFIEVAHIAKEIFTNELKGE